MPDAIRPPPLESFDAFAQWIDDAGSPEMHALYAAFVAQQRTIDAVVAALAPCRSGDSGKFLGRDVRECAGEMIEHMRSDRDRLQKLHELELVAMKALEANERSLARELAEERHFVKDGIAEAATLRARVAELERALDRERSFTNAFVSEREMLRQRVEELESLTDVVLLADTEALCLRVAEAAFDLGQAEAIGSVDTNGVTVESIVASVLSEGNG